MAPYLLLAGAGVATAPFWIETAGAMVIAGVTLYTARKAFDFAKFTSNKSICEKMCVADRMEAPLLAKITALHFTEAVKSLISESQKEETKFIALRNSLKNEKMKQLLEDVPFRGKHQPMPVDQIISRFSQSPSPVLDAYIHSGAHCLMNCPNSTTIANFTCEFINKMEDNLDLLLYFAQLLSISHNNFVSLDGIKNSNLARFLKATRSNSSAGGIKAKAKRIIQHDDTKYGTPETNKCVQRFAHERGDDDVVHSTPQYNETFPDTPHPTHKNEMVKKIKVLIEYQLSLEHQTRVKVEEAIQQDYDHNSCTDCGDGHPHMKNDDDLKDLHHKCQKHIHEIKATHAEESNDEQHGLIEDHHADKKEEQKRKKMIHALIQALNPGPHDKKLSHYQECIRLNTSAR